MTPEIAHKILLPASKSLFKSSWYTPEAQAMMIVIALQESDFIHRQQLIGHHRNWWESIKGPAVSFWQFERIGIRGVLTHHSTRQKAAEICEMFGYPTDVEVLHQALKHNDLLAACFARLLLYTVPQRLPSKNEPAEGWNQYLIAWRPGKPSQHRWSDRWAKAWSIVG